MLGRTEDKQEEAQEAQEMEHHVTEMENESVLSPKKKIQTEIVNCLQIKNCGHKPQEMQEIEMHLEYY